MASLKKTSAWTNFSKYIRARDGNVCISCGTTEGAMHAGHFIQAHGNKATYFDERNVNCQCYQCNYYGDQETGYNYGEALKKKYGCGIIKELQEKSREYKTFSPEDLKALSRKYKDMYKELLK